MTFSKSFESFTTEDTEDLLKILGISFNCICM